MPLFTREDIPPSLRAHVPSGARLTFPQQGMTSEIAFADGDSRCVVKRCRDPIYLEWLAREHRALRALEGLALPVPRVLGHADVDSPGAPREIWMVMSRLDGGPLWTEFLNAGALRRARLLHQLGHFLRRLHDTPVPANLRSDTPWIDRMLAEAERNLAWCDGTAGLLADLRRRRPEPVADVLIHGDLALDNVLIADDEAMSLVDWPGGAQGDPRCDIALALSTEPEVTLGEPELSAFFEGYGGKPLDRPTRRWFEDLYEFF